MFNTLKYAKMMEDVGFSREQSETSVRILVEVMDEKLATKIDLKNLEVVLKSDIQELRYEMHETTTELRAEMKELGTELRAEIKDLDVRMGHQFQNVDSKIEQLKSDLTIRMGTMLAASIAILTAIQKIV